MTSHRGRRSAGHDAPHTVELQDEIAKEAQIAGIVVTSPRRRCRSLAGRAPGTLRRWSGVSMDSWPSIWAARCFGYPRGQEDDAEPVASPAKVIGCLYCGAGSEGGAIPEVES